METKELRKQVYDKFLLVLVEQAKELQVFTKAIDRYADTDIRVHFETIIKEKFYRWFLSIFTQLMKSDKAQEQVLALTVLEESLIRCGLIDEKEGSGFQTLRDIEDLKTFAAGLQFMAEEVWEKINE